MPDYAELKSELAKPAYAGMSDEEAAAALNAETITIPINLAVSDAEGYLRLNARISALEDWIAAHPTPSAARYAARELLGLLTGKVITMETSNATKRAALSNMFAALVAAGAGGITQADSDALFGMAQTMVSWARQNGWPVIGPGDVANAREA